MRDWSLEEALAWLADHVNLEAGLPERLAAPTLDRMAALAQLSGDPQHAAPVVHITGTNGKGSTARLVTDLLVAHGLDVGTYTSPDLERVNERLARNGEPIDDDELVGVLGDIADLELVSGIRPSRFEILTLAAFRWFADVAVDVVVLEVGLGGTWDATNVADATVAVVTNVELDHTLTLGPTRADVAGEKSGIVKPRSTLVLGERDPALVPIFERAGPAHLWLRGRDFDVSRNRLAVGGRSLDLRTPNAAYEDVFLSLHGAHQGENAAIALAATEAFFDRAVEEEVVRAAFGSTSVPGRFEIVGRSPLVVLDGAHNPAGARAAAATLGDFHTGGGVVLVVGMSGERDPIEMLEALGAGSARVVVATEADTPRAMPVDVVAAAARSLGLEVESVADVAGAVERAGALAAPEDVVFVTGSLYVVGTARAALR